MSGAFDRKLGSTTYAMPFFMADETDHITGKTGLAPTVSISKNGAAFVVPNGAVSELAHGWYLLAGNATDRNAVGPFALHATAAGADPSDNKFAIIESDPFDDVIGTPVALDGGAATVGGMLTKMADDNSGLDFDAEVDSLERIAASITAAADAAYTPSASDGVVGNENGTTYAKCSADNNDRWEITDEGLAIEAIAVFQIGTNRIATSLTINGYFDSGHDRIVSIYAYNWTTLTYDSLGGGSDETEMRNIPANKDVDYLFALSDAFTKPTATIGEVRIKFVAQTQNAGDILKLDYLMITGASSGAASPSTIANAVHDKLAPVLHHIPCFAGTIRYVNGITGNDTNRGEHVDEPLATIGAAIAASAAGDMIKVFAGTYDEAGFELPAGKDGLELRGEQGVTLTDSGAHAQTLLLSGNNQVVTGLTITEAGQIGVKVDGNACVLEDIISGLGNTTSFDIDGVGVVMRRCFAALPTVCAFDFGGGQMKVFDCHTISTAATRGFWVSAGNYGIISGCTSNGHSVAGFQVDAGVDKVEIIGCSSGDSDGDKVDAGTNTSWRRFDDAATRKANVISMETDTLTADALAASAAEKIAAACAASGVSNSLVAAVKALIVFMRSNKLGGSLSRFGIKLFDNDDNELADFEFWS